MQKFSKFCFYQFLGRVKFAYYSVKIKHREIYFQKKAKKKKSFVQHDIYFQTDTSLV